jgi:hypothetical protein
MKNYVLIKYEANYADEYKIHGLKLMTLEEWEEKKKALKEFFSKVPVGEEITYNFGTNEWIEYSSKKQVLQDLDVSKITEDAFNVMTNILGSNEFGHMPYLWRVCYENDADDLEWSL